MSTSVISDKNQIDCQTLEERAIWEIGRALFQAEQDRQDKISKDEGEAGWHSARCVGLAPIFMLVGAGMWSVSGYVGYKTYAYFMAKKDAVPLVQIVSPETLEQPQNASVITLNATTEPVKVLHAQPPSILNMNTRGDRN